MWPGPGPAVARRSSSRPRGLETRGCVIFIPRVSESAGAWPGPWRAEVVVALGRVCAEFGGVCRVCSTASDVEVCIVGEQKRELANDGGSFCPRKLDGARARWYPSHGCGARGRHTRKAMTTMATQQGPSFRRPRDPSASRLTPAPEKGCRALRWWWCWTNSGGVCFVIGGVSPGW